MDEAMTEERREELRHMVNCISKHDDSHGEIFDREVRECLDEVDRLREFEESSIKNCAEIANLRKVAEAARIYRKYRSELAGVPLDEALRKLNGGKP